MRSYYTSTAHKQKTKLQERYVNLKKNLLKNYNKIIHTFYDVKVGKQPPSPCRWLYPLYNLKMQVNLVETIEKDDKNRCKKGAVKHNKSYKNKKYKTKTH